MLFEQTTLGDVSKGGKGNYGIAASAVDYSDELYTYLRITDIKDDGTIDFGGLKSVNDGKAANYLLQERVQAQDAIIFMMVQMVSLCMQVF